MNFSITTTGVNLTIGEFNHCDECLDQTDYVSQTIFEDIESNNTSYRAVIESARAMANLRIKEEEVKETTANRLGFDTHTPIELNRLCKLRNGINTLESLLDDFHKN